MDTEVKEKLKSYLERYGKVCKMYGEELIRKQTYESMSDFCFYMLDREGYIKNTDLYMQSINNIKLIEEESEKFKKRIEDFIDSL